MKKSIIILAVAASLIAVGLFRHGRSDIEFDTTRKAYELYNLGNDEMQAFKYPQAEDLLAKAVEADPGFAMAQAAQAELFFRQRRVSEGQTALARAESLSEHITDESERVLVALRLSQMNRSTLARRDSLLKAATAIHPDHLMVLAGRAFLAEARGDQKAEEKAWRAVLEKNPNYGNAYNSLGYLLARQGRYDEGISYLKKYVYLAPGLANPHDSLGEVLSWTGRYEEAEAEYRKALELQPDFFYSLLNLGRLYIAQGRLEKGVHILRETREQFSGTEIARNVDSRLINAYYSNDLYDQLVPIMRGFIERNPEDPTGQYYRAILLAMTGEVDHAEALKDSIITEMRSDSAYSERPAYRREIETARWRLEAMFAQVRHQKDRELEAWQEVMELNRDLPPHARLQFTSRYAESLLDNGRAAEAKAEALDLLAVNPRSIRPLLLLAEASFDLGEMDEARSAIEKLDAVLRFADDTLPAVERVNNLKRQLASLQNP